MELTGHAIKIAPRQKLAIKLAPRQPIELAPRQVKNQPTIIMVFGPTGSGKTSLAEYIMKINNLDPAKFKYIKIDDLV